MKKELRTINGEFDSNNSFKIILPDDIEGDMTFLFQLSHDDSMEQCHTTFNADTELEATITIYNAPINKSVSLPEDIEIGTYGNQQKLYMNYKLSTKEAEQSRIVVSFYVEED